MNTPSLNQRLLFEIINLTTFSGNFKPSKQKGFDLEWLDSYNQYMGWFNGTYADDDTDEDDNDYGKDISLGLFKSRQKDKFCFF